VPAMLAMLSATCHCHGIEGQRGGQVAALLPVPVGATGSQVPRVHPQAQLPPSWLWMTRHNWRLWWASRLPLMAPTSWRESGHLPQVCSWH